MRAIRAAQRYEARPPTSEASQAPVAATLWAWEAAVSMGCPARVVTARRIGAFYPSGTRARAPRGSDGDVAAAAGL